jgi:hypothetical protein
MPRASDRSQSSNQGPRDARRGTPEEIANLIIFEVNGAESRRQQCNG